MYKLPESEKEDHVLLSWPFRCVLKRIALDRCDNFLNVASPVIVERVGHGHPSRCLGLCKKAFLIRGCLPFQIKLENILSSELNFFLEMNTGKFCKRYMNLGIIFILNKLICPANDNGNGNANPLVTNTSCCCFYDTYLWLRLRVIVWLLRELLGLVMPAVYHTVPCWTHYRWGLPDGGAEPDRAVTQPTPIQWKFRVKHWCFPQLGRIEVGSPQTNHTRVCLELDLFNKVSVWLFWSALESDGCVHTFPNKLHQGVNAPGFDSTELNKEGVKTP